jgi:hypothetical protein
VREKPTLLEDASDPPSMRRDADRALGIEQNLARRSRTRCIARKGPSG